MRTRGGDSANTASFATKTIESSGRHFSSGKSVAYLEIGGGGHDMTEKAEEGASAVLSWLAEIGILTGTPNG